MRTLALFVILATSTTAHAEPKTVSWFLAHPTAREQVHKLCMNDPGEAKHTPDCLNAATAVEQSYINSIPTPSLAEICAGFASADYRRAVGCPR